MTNNSEKERVEGSEGVIEGNRLIAAFMDDTYTVERGDTINFLIKPSEFEGTNSFDVSDLKYHTSWDWLMPVCQKINAPESLIKVEMNGVESITPYLNAKREMCNGAIRFDLERTWKGVVSFIKYHNQQKNK